MRTDRQRVEDMVQAIDRITARSAAGRGPFDANELVQTWVLYHLQIVGEAAGGVSEGARRRFPAIPWAQIVGMRHILVHDYFGVDLDAVWNTVEKDLPGLRTALARFLESEA